jgi:hypothetical protein
MKTLLFVISFLIFLSSCIKDPVSSCKQENTLVQVKQYDAIECPYDEFNFLIKSEKQRDSIFKKYSCFTSSSYFEPGNFNQSWMIGGGIVPNNLSFKVNGELYKDTCNKTIEYRLILINDSTSSKMPQNESPLFLYCIMEALDNSWKINFTRQVINTKF